MQEVIICVRLIRKATVLIENIIKLLSAFWLMGYPNRLIGMRKNGRQMPLGREGYLQRPRKGMTNASDANICEATKNGKWPTQEVYQKQAEGRHEDRILIGKLVHLYINLITKSSGMGNTARSQ